MIKMKLNHGVKIYEKKHFISKEKIRNSNTKIRARVVHAFFLSFFHFISFPFSLFPFSSFFLTLGFLHSWSPKCQPFNKDCPPALFFHGLFIAKFFLSAGDVRLEAAWAPTRAWQHGWVCVECCWGLVWCMGCMDVPGRGREMASRWASRVG